MAEKKAMRVSEIEPETHYPKLVYPGHPNSSWLERIRDTGWSIEVTPSLSPEQWDWVTPELPDTWVDGVLSSEKLLWMLRKHLPRARLRLWTQVEWEVDQARWHWNPELDE